MSPKEKVKTRRVENYIMARKSPWMLWRVLAYEQGYVPPLLEGEIPDDIPMNLGFNRTRVETPLLLQAETMANLEMQNNRVASIQRHVIAFLLGLSIAIASIGFFKAATSDSTFQIPAVVKYVGN